MSRALCCLLPVEKKIHYFNCFFVKCIIKQLFDSVFCDIQNNQGLGKGYQSQPSASAVTSTSTLIIQDITKTSSNNCLKTVELKRNTHIETNKQTNKQSKNKKGYEWANFESIVC